MDGSYPLNRRSPLADVGIALCVAAVFWISALALWGIWDSAQTRDLVQVETSYIVAGAVDLRPGQTAELRLDHSDATAPLWSVSRPGLTHFELWMPSATGQMDGRPRASANSRAPAEAHPGSDVIWTITADDGRVLNQGRITGPNAEVLLDATGVIPNGPTERR